MVQREDRLSKIVIEARSPVPVYEQIKQGIKLLIMSGQLQPGDKLLPIRELAGKLKVNANTIVKVYYQYSQTSPMNTLPKRRNWASRSNR